MVFLCDINKVLLLEYLLFVHAPVRGLIQVREPEHCGGFRFGGNEKQIICMVLCKHEGHVEGV